MPMLRPVYHQRGHSSDLVQVQVGPHSHWVSHLHPFEHRSQARFWATSLSSAEDILRKPSTMCFTSNAAHAAVMIQMQMTQELLSAALRLAADGLLNVLLT